MNPVEHDALHVLDEVISTRPPEHAVQLDAVTLQLAQLLDELDVTSVLKVPGAHAKQTDEPADEA